MTYYKALDTDGTSPIVGFSWPLPKPDKRFKTGYRPGDWVEAEGPLEECENGIHLCKGEVQLLDWLNSERIFVAEHDGDYLDGNKFVCRRARLLYPIAWDERTARLFACDCAEHVLEMFEKEHPNDKRPREAIEVARRYANGEATVEELAAARDAAGDAAGAAAWDAEREWQAKELRKYLEVVE